MSDEAKDANAADNNQQTDQAQQAARPDLTPEQEAQAAETFRQLGEVVTLMTVSAQHKHMFLTDLEWMGLPAIVQRQCYLYKEGGRTLGAVFWARVTGEVEDRFKRGTMKLTPGEWKAGDNLWIVNVIDPFRKGEDILKVFAAAEEGANSQEFKFLSTNDKGERVIAKWRG